MSSIARERTKGPPQVRGDLYGAFLSYVERERAPQTRASYGRILGQLQAIHPTPDNITAEQIREWLNRPVGDKFHAEGPRAISTKRTEIGCLKAFWRFLNREHGLTNTMAEVVMPPKPRRLRPKSVSRAEVNDLLSVIPTEQQRALVLLMADAGLRVSEACNLTPDRIVLNGKRRHLRVLGKGNVERLVPIGGRLASALAVQMNRRAQHGWAANEPLIRTRMGKPYTRGIAWDFVAVAGFRAGIANMHPHRLRHSWACWLHYERHIPLGMVSRALGHASLSITQDYLGVRDEELFASLDFFE